MCEIVTAKHTIRLGKQEDIPQIIEFIKEEWNPNHIFVKSREFFEYEHCIDGRVNGILAINNMTSEIEGILMFYQTQRELKGADFYGGIWCVSKKCSVPMLGVKLVQSVKKITGTRGHSGVGINPQTTARIFRRIEEQFVGKMEHYYRLADLDVYKVAVIEEKKITGFISCDDCKLVNLQSFEQIKKVFEISNYASLYPYKDEWYIEKRYFNHPIYHYLVYGIKVGTEIEGLLVMREIEQNAVKILRIIDFIGKKCVLAKVGQEVQRLMDEKKVEYVDFYEYGIEDEFMEAAGFVKKEENDKNIIPNYFEPFVCKNVDLWFHSPYQNFTVFKGDADQDRPNMI